MVSYRTSLNDFMLDQLDFIECKLREAIDDAASQKGAIIEASGVVPQIKERLWFEDEGRAVSCLLVFPSLVERGGENWWNELANMGRDQFVREAKGLLGEQGAVAALRCLFKSNWDTTQQPVRREWYEADISTAPARVL